MKSPKYKSGLERSFAARFGLPYEPTRIAYTQLHHYSPDWLLAPDHYMETKGRWVAADRAKVLRVLKEHPHITLVLVFWNADLRLSKRSKTTYAQFCLKHRITWFQWGDPALDQYIEKHSVTEQDQASAEEP